MANQYGTTSEAVAYFVVKQKIANASSLTTVTSRKELKLLMESLGIASEAIEQYNRYITEGNRLNSEAATYRAKESAYRAANDIPHADRMAREA